MFNSSNSEVRSPRAKHKNDTTSREEIDTYSSFSYFNDNSKVKIPKIIFQTWIDKNIPDKWKVSPKSIKKYMPDWEYVFMTDDDYRNFVKKHFPDFLPYYDGFPHNIMRADCIRYMWLFIRGGIYMDLDFEVLHPLDELFTSDVEVYFVNSSNVGSYLTNSFMASKPGCKLWLDVIEEMKKPLPWYYVGKHMSVMNQSGPVMLTHVVHRSRIVYGMLPVKRILPCSICNISCRSKYAYLKQLEGSSWITYDTKVYNFFMCNYKQLLIAIGLILLVILIALLVQWFGWV